MPRISKGFARYLPARDGMLRVCKCARASWNGVREGVGCVERCEGLETAGDGRRADMRDVRVGSGGQGVVWEE